MIKLSEAVIRQTDPQKMYDLVAGFPQQWNDAVARTENLQLTVDRSEIRNILICGMGGSAIGGDMIKAYTANTCEVPVEVNRHYEIPSWVDEHTLLVASSYSGNTEETLQATETALRRDVQAVCITTGGKMKQLSDQKKLDCIGMPPGMQPRAALAASFVPQYRIFEYLGFTGSNKNSLIETGEFLQKRKTELADLEHSTALKLAEQVKDTIPIVYSDATLLAPVNLRWRGQFEENAKTLAYGNLFPEMNHNEIVGWENIGHLNKKISVIMLQDEEDGERIRLRMKIIKELIGDQAAGYHVLKSEGPNRLARQFSLVQLADWTSLYLAFLYETDPTPIRKIDLLKKKLGN